VQLLSEKQRLTGRCKELLERIKVEEEETAAAVEEVRKKCAAELQRAYDTWGEGALGGRGMGRGGFLCMHACVLVCVCQASRYGC
jgi:hypothetical protein